MQDVGIRILVVGLLGRGTQSGQTSNCDQPDLNLPYDIFLKSIEIGCNTNQRVIMRIPSTISEGISN